LATRLYLHRGSSTVGGTLPATTVSVSTTTPTWTPGTTNSSANTPLLTNRTMDETIGASAQTSLAYTTDNVTTDQKQPFLRWISPPLAAQTIASQAIDVQYGTSQSNTASSFAQAAVVAVWRPSTGAVVGRMENFSAGGGATGTTQGVRTINITASTSVTAQAGDVIVVEIWRNSVAQTMASPYTNTVFYDGTTENSTTDVAAYINFANTVTFQASPQTVTPGFISSAEALYNPTVSTPAGAIEPGFISSAEALYAPTVKLKTEPGFISSAEALHSPTVKLKVEPDFIGTGEALYSPTVSKEPYLFSDDFESGTFNSWNSTDTSSGSTATANGTSAYEGSYGFQSVLATTPNNGVSRQWLEGNIGTTTTSQLSLQVRMNPVSGSYLSGEEVVFLRMLPANFARDLWVVNSHGDWRLYLPTQRDGTGGPVVSFTNQPSLNQWYSFELFVDWTGSDQVYQLYVDGVLEAEIIDSSTGSDTVWKVIQVGQESVGTTRSSNYTTYFDNVLVADHYIGVPLTAQPGFISSAEVLYSPTVKLEVEPDFISSAETLHSPTVKLQVHPGFISSAEALHAPTVKLKVEPGFISSAETLFSPTVKLLAIPGFIATAETLYAPTVKLQAQPNFIATAEVLHAPTVALKVEPGFIATAEALYAPTVALKVEPGFVSSAEALYAPTVSLGGGASPQTVAPGFISTAETLYAPTVLLKLQPGFISTGEALYSPTVKLLVQPGFIASAEALYGPTALLRAQPGFISSAEALYAPTALLRVQPGFIASAETLHAPTVKFLVQPGFIASGEALYNPTLVTAQTVQPGFIGSGEAIYEPRITGVAQLVQPGFIPSPGDFGGDDFGDNTLGGVLYLPTVTLLMQPGFVPTAEVLYPPTVLHTNLSVIPDLIPALDQIYGPSLYQLLAGSGEISSEIEFKKLVSHLKREQPQSTITRLILDSDYVRQRLDSTYVRRILESIFVRRPS
jgi:hypothetical protein